MRQFLFCLCFLFVLTCVAASEEKCRIEPPYHGIKVISFTAESKAQAKRIESIATEYCELFLFGDNEHIRVGVPTVMFVTEEQYQALIKEQKQPSSGAVELPSIQLVSDDLNSMLAKGPRQQSGYTRTDGAGLGRKGEDETGSNPPLDRKFYEKYWSYEDMMMKWGNISTLYSPHVRSEVMGQSIEQRPVLVYRLGQTSRENPRRVFLNCLQHAREWITPQACTYLLESLAISVSTDEGELADLLEGVEVIIAPMVNPDGYVYSSDVYRLARKNRRKAGCAVADFDGVDLNRNWAVDFGGSESTEDNVCSEVYFGKAAFSEPESDAIRRFVSRTPGIRAHADIHSFGELVLGAWGYTDDPAPQANLSLRIGKAIEKSMNGLYNSNFKFGRGSELLYLASGICSDWFTDQGAISYTFELQPSLEEVTTADGFQLPERQILAACEENLAGVKVLLKYAADPDTPNLSLGPGSDDPGSSDGGGGLSVGAIAGIVAAGVVLTAIIVVAVVLVGARRRIQNGGEQEVETDIEGQGNTNASGSTQVAQSQT